MIMVKASGPGLLQRVCATLERRPVTELLPSLQMPLLHSGSTRGSGVFTHSKGHCVLLCIREQKVGADLAKARRRR